GDPEHIQAVHAHPGSAIRLLKMTSRWQGCTAVEDADVVQSQEATLKDVVSLAILAIDPPGEIEQEFVEDPLQEAAIGLSGRAFLDFIHTPCRPGMNGRVHISERPLVGGKLTIGMHIPLTQE